MPAACSTKRANRRFRSSAFGRDREKSSFHRFQHKQEGPSAVGHKLPADLCASALSRPGHKSVIPADALVGGGICIDRGFCGAKIMSSRAWGGGIGLSVVTHSLPPPTASFTPSNYSSLPDVRPYNSSFIVNRIAFLLGELWRWEPTSTGSTFEHSLSCP